jgi:hypothetical protein
MHVSVYACVCLIVCDIEMSTMRLPNYDLAVATQKNRNLAYINICLMFEYILYFIPCNLNVYMK